ncbi:MAG: KUP/HAK/KT family potassium transporter [Burkholderiales bacterium]|jgi:hypothetical protein
MSALDGRLDVANLALILVLAAAVAALWWPPLASTAANAAAVLAFNVAFVPPRGVLDVELREHALLPAVNAVLLAGCAVKLFDGGWLPLALGLVLFVAMSTWWRGRALMLGTLRRGGVALEDFLVTLHVDEIPRAARTAVYPVADPATVPRALLHNLKHNQVLHETNVILTVEFASRPWVPAAERAQVEALGRGFWRVVLRYGFMERPDVPAPPGCSPPSRRARVRRHQLELAADRVGDHLRAALVGHVDDVDLLSRTVNTAPPRVGALHAGCGASVAARSVDSSGAPRPAARRPTRSPHPMPYRSTFAAAILVALCLPAAHAQSAASPQVVAAIDPSRGADVAALRTRAWRDDARAQMGLAMVLGDAHRRGASESSMVEAAYWAGRAWHAPTPVSPDAMAAFVASNCGSAAISRHWVCTEGE